MKSVLRTTALAAATLAALGFASSAFAARPDLVAQGLERRSRARAGRADRAVPHRRLRRRQGPRPGPRQRPARRVGWPAARTAWTSPVTSTWSASAARPASPTPSPSCRPTAPLISSSPTGSCSTRPRPTTPTTPTAASGACTATTARRPTPSAAAPPKSGPRPAAPTAATSSSASSTRATCTTTPTWPPTPFKNPGDSTVDGVDNDGNGLVDDVYGWDFDGNNSTVFDGTADDHGTHVAGTIGGMGGNGTGVAGVCWSVKLMSAKFLGSRGGTTANAIKAVDYFTDLKVRPGPEHRRHEQLVGRRRLLAGAQDAIEPRRRGRHPVHRGGRQQRRQQRCHGGLSQRLHQLPT